VQVTAAHADFSTTVTIYGHLMPGVQRRCCQEAGQNL